MIHQGSWNGLRGALVLLSAVLLLSVSTFADAKAKTKAKAKSKSKAAQTEPKSDATAPEADAPKTDEADTDADEIFTEDELTEKSGTADEKTDSKSEETAEPDEKAEASESNPLAEASDEKADTADETAGETPDETAAGDDEVEEVGEVEVLSSSEGKKGFFPTEFDGPDTVRRDRGFNILTARATRPMALTFVIDHRPYMKIAGNDAEAEDVFFNYLGLDGGNLKVGLGLRFGIIEGLDAGLYRLNDGGTVPFDTYEFDVRYAFLKQEKFYVDMSVRAGLSWFSQKNADDAVGGYGEIFIDHVFFDMLLVGAGFQFHSDSTSDVKNREDTSYSGAVLGVIEWRLIKQLALTAEIAAAVVGYGSEYGDPRRPSIPGFSLGLKILTHRHTFALMVSNTQFINADGIVANSWRDFSDIIFGFQIFREFNFK